MKLPDLKLPKDFIEALYRLPTLLIAFMIHELSHAVVALAFGDDTAKKAGRITLNPLKHLDPLGALMVLVARFGWAKPVPIDPGKFRRRKLGIVCVSLAGPLSNVVLAVAATLGLAALALGSVEPGWPYNFLFEFMLVNLSLAVFNLIPIPPLDGSKVLFAVLPDRIYYGYVLRYERFGMIALLALSFTGVLSRIIGPPIYGAFGVLSGMLQAIVRS
jgi:Zn-dependent protease